jgi:hypothetical protein
MIVILIITAVVFGVLGFVIGRKKQPWAENIGESSVRKHLLKTFPEIEYHLMNNITLPFKDGTTQIDNILVSRYGIFVIETKNYKGWIFGDESSKTWTQVIFNLKFKFSNPIHQNSLHVRVISELLDFIPKDLIHSLIVFTGDAKFKTSCPQGVVDLYGLPNYIRMYKEIVITKNRMQFCVGRIESIRKIISRETDVEHQEYLIRKHNNKWN